jgi:hypothetical protein
VTVQHSIYGLSIRANRTLPGVPERVRGPEPTVEVILGSLPDHIRSARQLIHVFPSTPLAQNQRPSLLMRLSADSGDFWLTYDDGAEFVVSGSGTRIWTDWPTTLTLDDAVTYLLGPVFGFLLRLRGILCLHASAVEVDGEGIVILGPPGAGKSTLAASFAEAGFAVLSDDVVPVVRTDRAFLVQPGYPRLRLWPDSVQALYGSPDSLPRITPTWDKRHLDLTGERYHFSDRPASLAGIYLLDERIDEDRAPIVEAMAPRDALLALIANTYANYLIRRDIRATEFGQLEQLVSVVPVRKVKPNSDARQTHNLRRAIVRDLAGRAQQNADRPSH